MRKCIQAPKITAYAKMFIQIGCVGGQPFQFLDVMEIQCVGGVLKVRLTQRISTADAVRLLEDCGVVIVPSARRQLLDTEPEEFSLPGYHWLTKWGPYVVQIDAADGTREWSSIPVVAAVATAMADSIRPYLREGRTVYACVLRGMDD